MKIINTDGASLIDIEKLNKSQRVIYDAIKRLEKGERLVIRQRCSGKQLMADNLKKFREIFVGDK